MKKEETEFAWDVFLSHSPDNKDVALDIANRLKSDGIRVWFNDWEIEPGESIVAKTEDGLERSRVLVLCVSEAAMNSDWAQLETSTARFRDPMNRRRRFVPIEIDDTPTKGSLSQFKHIDWKNPEEAYPALLNACQSKEDQYVDKLKALEQKIAKRILQLETRITDTIEHDTPETNRSKFSFWSWLVPLLAMGACVSWSVFVAVTQFPAGESDVKEFRREISKLKEELREVTWKGIEMVDDIDPLKQKNTYQVGFWTPSEDTKGESSWESNIEPEQIARFTKCLHDTGGIVGSRRVAIIGVGRTKEKQGLWWSVTVRNDFPLKRIGEIYREVWKPDRSIYIELKRSRPAGYLEDRK